MGRYYSGDIEGKFMFAVQSSHAADRFGSSGYTGYLNYYFDREHLGTINKELSDLKKSYKKVKKFFKGRGSWTTADQEEAGISPQQMSDYADYCLGKKIKECIEEYGECRFDAEM